MQEIKFPPRKRRRSLRCHLVSDACPVCETKKEFDSSELLGHMLCRASLSSCKSGFQKVD